jgi:hypothetical protein
MGRQAASQPTSRAWVAGPDGRADWPDLVAGGQDGDHRAAPDHEVGGARGGRGGEISGAQPVPLGEQQFRGAHILADGPDMLVGRGGRAQFGGVILIVHVLTHDHRIAPVGHRVAGVHHVVAARRQQHRGGLAGPDGVRGPDRDAVHAGRIERR